MNQNIKFGVIVALVAGIASANADDAAPAAKRWSFTTAKNAKWADSPVAGVKMAMLRGDLKTGTSASYTKFEPGADHGWHTHTNDVEIVGVAGAYLFEDERGNKRRIGPGEFLSIPGGLKHRSGSDKKWGCTLLQFNAGPFDFSKAEAPPPKPEAPKKPEGVKPAPAEVPVPTPGN